MMRKIFIFILFYFMGLVALHAQDDKTSNTKNDSTFLVDEGNKAKSGFAKEVLSDTSINFNDYLLNKDSVITWNNKKEYEWIKNIDSFLIAKKEEAIQQSKNSTKQNNKPSFISNIFNTRILQFILWLIVATLVLFIIYRLFVSEGFFGKRSAVSKLALATAEEEFPLSSNYDDLINKALAKTNLRLAIRFLFLKTLQKLNERGLIIYAADKTNATYLKELPKTKRDRFASFTLYYEYVWYGNINIDSTMFNSIKTKVDEFLNTL